ncbi:MAG: hypothetical protein R2804_08575 [Cyclobacteriaceae bacterium]
MMVKFRILILLSLLGCNTPEYLSESQLQSFIANPDHGLIKTTSSNNIEVKLLYKPTDLLVAQELNTNKNFDFELVETIRRKYENYLYFVLSLSHDNREVITPASLGQDRFSDMLQTVSFRMAQFVNITTPSMDTLTVADYAYSRTFGMARSTDLLLVFEKEKCANQPWLQFNLKEFGLGLGNQALRFDMQDIINVPKIYKNQK